MTRLALITGGTGMIGQALIPHLRTRGFQVKILTRHPRSAEDIRWNANSGAAELAALEGAELLVHLAGANVGAKRWSEAYKEELWDSRVLATRTLFSQLGKLTSPPKIVISAAAIGLYGDRGDETLTESSSPSEGFLPELARAWEEESTAALNFGARLAQLRFGIVLSTKGGALERMLLPFSFGLGGKLGAGRQWMSWITLNDLTRATLFILENESLHGAFNFCSPTPVTNAEFTSTLGATLHRPTLLTLPTPLISLVFGEMGRALLLGNTRAIPERLLGAGFRFEDEALSTALTRILSERL